MMVRSAKVMMEKVGRYYLPAVNDYARIGELDFSLLFPFSLLVLIFFGRRTDRRIMIRNQNASGIRST